MKTVNRGQVPEMIASRTPFKISTGNLRGEAMPEGTRYIYAGWLNEAEAARLYADTRRIRYVIFSYQTPIAWVLDDGSTYRVSQRFSMTTSHHQGRLYTLEARPNHSDGSPDMRYSIAEEGTGNPDKPWVVRFCGDWLGTAPTALDALWIARQHKDGELA